MYSLRESKREKYITRQSKVAFLQELRNDAQDKEEQRRDNVDDDIEGTIEEWWNFEQNEVNEEEVEEISDQEQNGKERRMKQVNVRKGQSSEEHVSKNWSAGEYDVKKGNNEEGCDVEWNNRERDNKERGKKKRGDEKQSSKEQCSEGNKDRNNKELNNKGPNNKEFNNEEFNIRDLRFNKKDLSSKNYKNNETIKSFNNEEHNNNEQINKEFVNENQNYTEQINKEENKESSGKRKRGRPKKKSTKNKETSKRPRGRPRKIQTGQSNETPVIYPWNGCLNEEESNILEDDLDKSIEYETEADLIEIKPEETEMASDRMQLVWDNHLQNISELFQILLDDDLMVDVTLSCREGSIKAHKLILSACSPYFRRVINENPCRHPIIIMRGVKHEELQLLVEYMYKGSINVPKQIFRNLMKLAMDLDVKGFENITNHEMFAEEGQSFLLKNLELCSNAEASSWGENSCGPSRETRFKGQKRVVVTHDDDVENSYTPSKKMVSFPIKTNNVISNIKIAEVRSIEPQEKQQNETNISNIPVRDNETQAEIEEEEPNYSDYVYLDTLQQNPVQGIKRFSSDEDDDEDYISPGEKRREWLSCTVCRRKFRSKKELVKHMQIHSKSFKCEFCKKTFTRTSHLIRHRRVHTGERPFICDVCGKDFARQDKLKLHRRSAHMEDLHVAVDLYNVTPSIMTSERNILRTDILDGTENSIKESESNNDVNNQKEESDIKNVQKDESIQDIGSQLQQRKDETEIKTEEEQFCTTLGDLTPCSSNELEKEEFDKDKPLKKRRGRPRKYPIKINVPKRPRGRPKKKTLEEMTPNEITPMYFGNIDYLTMPSGYENLKEYDGNERGGDNEMSRDEECEKREITYNDIQDSENESEEEMEGGIEGDSEMKDEDVDPGGRNKDETDSRIKIEGRLEDVRKDKENYLEKSESVDVHCNNDVSVTNEVVVGSVGDCTISIETPDDN